MTRSYVIYVDDNYHYMDESERYKLGEFDDCQSAIAACQKIVEEFLNKCDPKIGADEMFKNYTGFGKDPWISTDDPACKFSAWDYARERSRELAQKM